MNQSKFSLADVLTFLSATVFGFICFLSVNFITLGDTNKSVIIALVVTFLLCGFALGAKWLKQTSRNFKTSFIAEMISLLLFAIIAFFSISVFSHYFALSAQKEHIQHELNATISQAENMYAEYENYAENRQVSYRKQLRDAVKEKNNNPQQYAALGFKVNTIPDERQIVSKMETINLKLFPSNFDEMKDKSGKWLSESKKVINNWNPIRIVDVVNHVEQNSKEWLAQLVKISEEREPGESTTNFAYDFTYDNAKTYFTNFAGVTPLSVTLALMAYILMLLTYFVSKRNSKNPYSLFSITTKGKGEIPNNDINIDY